MLSIVTPVYNEDKFLKETISIIHTTLKTHGFTDYEVIVVNDGSTDDTAKVAEKLDATLCTHPRNAGYGQALKTGIAAAKYDTIVITDADGTYPFEEFPKLYHEYQKGFDMVVGARTGKYYRESWFKYPLRKILKFLVEFTCGKPVDDVNSGFRIFKKSLVENNQSQLCNTFSFTTTLTLAAFMTDKFVSYIPIGYNDRVGETKVRLFKDSLRTLQYILQAVNYYNPIKLYLLFFVFCILCSLIGFAMSALAGLTSGFLLGIGGLLVALMVLVCGLIADLLRHVAQGRKSGS